MRHGDGDRADFLRAALIHGRHIPDTFRLQPMAGFVDRDHLWPKLVGERHGVMDMIEVPVRNQDRIHALDLVLGGIRWIALGPGIHKENFASAQTNLKRAVSKPGNFDHHLAFYPPVEALCL
jgi:hypothetical protein